MVLHPFAALMSYLVVPRRSKWVGLGRAGSEGRPRIFDSTLVSLTGAGEAGEGGGKTGLESPVLTTT